VSGSNYILDTNVVLYLLGGKLQPSEIPPGSYSISFITELELLGYPGLSFSESAVIEEYIRSTRVIDINNDIKQRTIALSKKHRLKLPDAIICATSQCNSSLLLTRDKQLKSIDSVIIL
jgi:predicted nucleic acid-binding protein